MIERKRWIYLIGTIIGACILSAALIYSMTKWIQAEEREASRIQHISEETDYHYLVTTYRGHIGIFDVEGYLQSEVMVSVDVLPMQDQKRLKEGISVLNEKELYALMEDFTG